MDKPKKEEKKLQVKSKRSLFGIIVKSIFILIYFVILIGYLFVFLPGSIEAIFADFSSDLDDPLPPRAIAHYNYMKEHLEEPFEGFGPTEIFIKPFASILLSHTACGLVNVAENDPSRKAEVTILLKETVDRALSTEVSPYGHDFDLATDCGDNNLYLSHLSLIIGCYKKVSGNTEYDELHKKINEHLIQKTLADGDFHAVSYPNFCDFPADQSVTILSMYMYDKLNGTELSREAVEGWLEYMKTDGLNKEYGLHMSSISSNFPNYKLPRGCALSWTVLYMSQFAPDDAQELYANYREKFYDEFLGFGGFREWPKDFDGGMSVDSGPIICGLGLAATGFGIGAARIQNDKAMYSDFMQSASTWGGPYVTTSDRKYFFSPLLGEAILFHATTTTHWFDKPTKKPVYKNDAPFPLPTIIIVVIIFPLYTLFVYWRSKKFYQMIKQNKTMVLNE